MGICSTLRKPGGPVPEGESVVVTMDISLVPGLRQAVGVFGDPKALGRAYRELIQTGFDDGDLCVMAPSGIAVGDRPSRWSDRLEKPDANDDEDARFGRNLIRDLAPSSAYCAAGPVYSSSGPICDILGRDESAGRQGDWLADMLSNWITRQSAEYLEDRLGEGKTLLWARIGSRSNSNRERLACTILLRHASESVRVLDFSFRA
jgi:hypothetical protein